MSLYASGRVTGKALERLRAQDRREAEQVARAEARQVRMARRLSECAAPAAGDWDTFLSLIDTTGGPDACHEWQGQRDWNHCDPNIERFERGNFELKGLHTRLAHRLVCIYSFGLTDIDPTIDVSPTCGNHLCCNLRHLVARPHGGKAGAVHVEAVSVADFFCAEAAKQDRREELEQAADRLLAA